MRILVFGETILPPAYLPRVLYFCSYLTEKEWDVDLVVESTDHMQYVSKKVDLYPIDYYRRKQGFLSKIEWLLKFIVSLIYDYKGHYFYRKSKSFWAEKEYDLIFCSSSFTFPLTTAAKTARKKNIPLFVDLRDIAEQSPDDNYYIAHKPSFLFGDIIINIYKKINIRRRNKILKIASAVTTVSPWHVKTLSKYNPNTHLIYNGFDENIFIPEKITADKFAISYFGRVYNEGLRDPRLIFIALSELRKKDIVSPENTVVKWYVDNQSKNVIRGIADRYDLGKFIEFHNFISPEKLNKEMNKSAILLILCNISTKKRFLGMMTTKFFEALGANRPVLCIPDNKDNLSEIIRETQCGLVSSDSKEVEDFLLEKFKEWQGFGRTAGMLNESSRLDFSREKGAKTLENLFLKAIKN